MARLPRGEVIDETEVRVCHCVQRAVRRAWLGGKDPLTGKSFEHRKVWITKRLEFLAGQFGIDVLAFSIMSMAGSSCLVRPRAAIIARNRSSTGYFKPAPV